MKMKRIFALLLCIMLLVCFPAQLFGAQGQSITVNPINIMVGGKVFLPADANGNAVAVFTYKGITYAPLRALAESYGLTVGYNPQSNLATVSGSPSAGFSGSKGNTPALTETTVIEVFPINIEVNGTVFQPVDNEGKAVNVFTYKGTTYALGVCLDGNPISDYTFSHEENGVISCVREGDKTIVTVTGKGDCFITVTAGGASTVFRWAAW